MTTGNGATPLSGDGPRASSETMARILGISVAHLGRLGKDATLPAPEPRKPWDVIATVQAFIGYRLSQAAPETEGIKSEELRLTIARREKTEAERDAQIMENDLERRNIVLVSDVARTVGAEFARVRSKLMGISATVAPHLALVKTATEARVLIDREIAEALKDLTYDAKSADA